MVIMFLLICLMVIRPIFTDDHGYGCVNQKILVSIEPQDSFQDISRQFQDGIYTLAMSKRDELVTLNAELDHNYCQVENESNIIFRICCYSLEVQSVVSCFDRYKGFFQNFSNTVKFSPSDLDIGSTLIEISATYKEFLTLQPPCLVPQNKSLQVIGSKLIRFVIVQSDLKVQLEPNSRCFSTDQEIQVHGSYWDPDENQRQIPNIVESWKCRKSNSENCTHLLQFIIKYKNGSKVIIPPHTLQNGNYTITYSVKDTTRTIQEYNQDVKQTIKQITFSIFTFPHKNLFQPKGKKQTDFLQSIQNYSDCDVSQNINHFLKLVNNTNILFPQNSKRTTVVHHSSQNIMDSVPLNVSQNIINKTTVSMPQNTLGKSLKQIRELNYSVGKNDCQNSFKRIRKRNTDNITSLQAFANISETEQRVNVDKEIKISGWYEDPNGKENFSSYMIQSWSCQKVSIRTKKKDLCNDLVPKNQTSQITLPPFSLKTGLRYEFTYKVKYSEDIKDYPGTKTEDQKIISFITRINKLEAFFQTEDERNVKVSAMNYVKASYKDPDVKETHNTFIAQDWSCVQKQFGMNQSDCQFLIDLFLHTEFGEHGQFLKLPPFSLKAGNTYTFQYKVFDTLNPRDLDNNQRRANAEQTIKVIIQSLIVTFIKIPKPWMMVNQEFSITIRHIDPDVVQQTGEHITEFWGCENYVNKENCSNVLKNQKLQGGQILTIAPFSLEAGFRYSVYYEVWDNRNLTDYKGNARKTRKQFNFFVVIQPLEVNISSRQDGNVFVNEELQITGFYIDPDVNQILSPSISEHWYCQKNQKENCTHLLSSSQIHNGTQIQIIPPYALEAGNNYTFTYKAKDIQGRRDFKQKLKEDSKSLTFMVRIQPITVALTSKQDTQIFVNEELRLTGSYKDPDVKEVISPNISEHWFCQKNEEYNCTHLLPTPSSSDDGRTIIIPPYTLDIGNNYIITYKAKDILNRKDFNDKPKEDSKQLSFTVMIQPITVNLTSNQDTAIQVNQELQLTGSYKDPDSNENFSSNISQHWHCENNQGQNCTPLLPSPQDIQGGQTLTVPPFTLEGGNNYTITYKARDALGRKDLNNKLKEDSKQLSFVVTVQPITATLTSKQDTLIQVKQELQLTGLFKDPDLKEQSSSNVSQDWYCKKNQEQDCKHLLPTPQNIQGGQTLTIPPFTLEGGNNYTFTYKARDALGRKDLNNKPKEDSKQLSFIVTVQPITATLTSKQDTLIQVKQELQLTGLFIDPDLKEQSSSNVSQEWFCEKNYVQDCNHLVDTPQNIQSGQILTVPPFTLEGGNNYTFTYKVRDIMGRKDLNNKPKEDSKQLSFTVTVQPITVTLTTKQHKVLQVNEELQLTGSFKDPDLKEQLGSNVSQDWYCEKNQGYDCSPSLPTPLDIQGGQTLTIPPFTLEGGNDYTFTYKARDVMGRKDLNNKPKEDSKQLSFIVTVQTIIVTLTSKLDEVLQVNQELQLTGLFKDPDLKEQFISNVSQNWYCEKNYGQDCNHLLPTAQDIQGGQTLTIPPFTLEGGNNYTFTYFVRDVMGRKTLSNKPKEGSKYLSFIVLILPITVTLTSKQDSVIQANQELQLTGLFKDPDLKEQLSSNVSQEWFCEKNQGQDCKLLLPIPQNIQGGQTLTIPPLTLKGGNNYTFIYTARDPLGRKDFTNKPKEDSKQLSFIVNIQKQPVNETDKVSNNVTITSNNITDISKNRTVTSKNKTTTTSNMTAPSKDPKIIIDSEKDTAIQVYVIIIIIIVIIVLIIIIILIYWFVLRSRFKFSLRQLFGSTRRGTKPVSNSPNLKNIS